MTCEKEEEGKEGRGRGLDGFEGLNKSRKGSVGRSKRSQGVLGSRRYSRGQGRDEGSMRRRMGGVPKGWKGRKGELELRSFPAFESPSRAAELRIQLWDKIPSNCELVLLRPAIPSSSFGVQEHLSSLIRFSSALSQLLLLPFTSTSSSPSLSPPPSLVSPPLPRTRTEL